METVDELMTPGCPQCAIKHLSAAIAYMVSAHAEPENFSCDPVLILAARARINLVEAAEGYASHKWYAIGLLEQAEELAVASNEVALARDIRVARLDPVPESTEFMITLDSVIMAEAHFAEARRELHDVRNHSEFPDTVAGALAAIARVNELYFSGPAVGADVNNEKEGGQKMACAKKAKCAAAKGGVAKKDTKAARKGGKCAGKKACK